VSDFRSNFSSLIDQVHDTKRPIVITQHGRSAAVLLDVSEYERMVDKFELIKEIETAAKQIDAGQGISHKQALRHLKDRIHA
ncbi:MAG: type II toxin-antitoxin system Phd/YefM family antitoxin, partial [bacterium]